MGGIIELHQHGQVEYRFVSLEYLSRPRCVLFKASGRLASIVMVPLAGQLRPIQITWQYNRLTLKVELDSVTLVIRNSVGGLAERLLYLLRRNNYPIEYQTRVPTRVK